MGRGHTPTRRSNIIHMIMADDGVTPIPSGIASEIVMQNHYLHRAPQISQSYGLIEGHEILGVITFGPPASRHLQVGVCTDRPDVVTELNRLWVDDCMPRNTETWFMSRALRLMPPRIVVSYADTAQGHDGTVYRAANFNYAGWTDMDRKTPRFDYVPVNGGHSRNATRKSGGGVSGRVRRLPKYRYWTTTGNRSERKALDSSCQWPKLDWKPHN